MRSLCAAALCIILAAPTVAEDNCGTMVRTVSRFRAKVTSVIPIGNEQTGLDEVEIEPRSVATVVIESVQEKESPLQAGMTRRLAVNDLATAFGTESRDTPLDLEAEWMQCDGKFRRLVGVRPLPPERVVESADRWLKPGHSYRAEARWDVERAVLALVRPIDLPYHHGGGIVFINVDDLPALPRDGSKFSMIFEVLSVEISYMGERRWLSLYDAKVISFEPPRRADANDQPQP